MMCSARSLGSSSSSCFQLQVFFGRIAAVPGPGDRPQGDLPVLNPHQHFRRRTHDLSITQIDEIHVGRRIQRPQRTVHIQRAGLEGHAHAL